MLNINELCSTQPPESQDNSISQDVEEYCQQCGFFDQRGSLRLSKKMLYSEYQIFHAVDPYIPHQLIEKLLFCQKIQFLSSLKNLLNRLKGQERKRRKLLQIKMMRSRLIVFFILHKFFPCVPVMHLRLHEAQAHLRIILQRRGRGRE